MTQEEIERIISQALGRLYTENLDILQLDVAERTVCARLAAILQPYFRNHAVHAEYNRHGIEPKEIELPDGEGTLTRYRVNPDIVVHQPGHDRENVLVIEVKKSTNAISDHADLRKLGQIKAQIAYRYALFLRLTAGPEAKLADVRTIWV